MAELRRRFERYLCQLDVTLMLDDRTMVAQTLNMGLGGMLLATDEKLEFGQDFDLSFQLPDPQHVINVHAKVMWCKPGAVGVSFDALRPIDVWALLQFFKRACAASQNGE